MKIVIDTESGRLMTAGPEGVRDLPLYSKEGFEALSRLWVKVGWNEKYAYTFSWFGRPVIQLPEDMVRAQEVLWRVRPTVVVETGVAHGGSLVFYASLLRLLGGGKVIGVDIEIRPHNRQEIEAHPFAADIALIEGDSVAPATLDRVRQEIPQGSRVLVFLDSCHTKDHVRKELEAYAPLVSIGSYIVATDGIMQDLYDVPRGLPSWKDDHPSAAAIEFALEHSEFRLEQPEWTFNESQLTENVTHWPQAWLKRVK
jgi:cephalosporin hydroxylase